MFFTGILIGAISFISIGIFHPIVIKGEYYFSKRIWPVFAIVGILLIGSSLFVSNSIISCSCAVVGMTCCWSVKELFDQEKRVEKGWFPENPNKKSK